MNADNVVNPSLLPGILKIINVFMLESIPTNESTGEPLNYSCLVNMNEFIPETCPLSTHKYGKYHIFHLPN